MRLAPVICGAVRTPIGKFQGGLASLRAPQLGAEAVKALLERTGLDPAQLDEVMRRGAGWMVEQGYGDAADLDDGVAERRREPRHAGLRRHAAADDLRPLDLALESGHADVGVEAIGVDWGHHDGAALRAAGARHVVGDAAALGRILLGK